MALTTMLATICLAGRMVLSPGGFGNERTLEQVLLTHDWPLLSAQSATMDQPRWVLWAGFLPVPAGRLAATDVQTVDPARRPNLAGRVLIYCEGNVSNGWAQLELSVKVLGSNMQRATPFLGQEGPGKNVLQMGKPPRMGYFTKTDPIRIILVSVDGKGKVTRVVTTRARELELSDSAGAARK